MNIEIVPIKCSCGATLTDEMPSVDTLTECDSCDSTEWLHPVEAPIKDEDIKPGMITVVEPTKTQLETSEDDEEIKTVNSGGSIYVGSDKEGEQYRIVPTGSD